MDPRLSRAQQLYWEIDQLERRGLHQAAIPKLQERARLRAELGMELLCAGDLDGLLDLYDAITAWGKSGARPEADRLLQVGR